MRRKKTGRKEKKGKQEGKKERKEGSKMGKENGNKTARRPPRTLNQGKEENARACLPANRRKKEKTGRHPRV
jgi:hypothetical protein